MDASASSFACSFVSLRLIVSTERVILVYYLTLMMGIVNVKTHHGRSFCHILHTSSSRCGIPGC